MTLYYAPFKRMARQHFMDRWMQENSMNTAGVIFPIDVKEDKDGYVITALLPGVKAEELDIQVVDETVTIQGELKNERDEKAQYLLVERPSGRFSRVLTLPTQLDPDKAEARVENGVLTLLAPKAETVRPRTIKVSVN